jgi:hypothetical protein
MRKFRILAPVLCMFAFGVARAGSTAASNNSDVASTTSTSTTAGDDGGHCWGWDNGLPPSWYKPCPPASR